MSAVKKGQRISGRNKSERRMGPIRTKRTKRAVKQAKRNPYVMRDGGPGGAGDDNGNL